MRIRAVRSYFKFVLPFVLAAAVVPFQQPNAFSAPQTAPTKSQSKPTHSASQSSSYQLKSQSKASKSTSQSKPSKKVPVWTVAVTNPWATLTFRTIPNAIRIDGSTGGCLVARAPDWKIMLFHAKDKRARFITIAEWQPSVKRGRDVAIYGKPTPCKINGIPALSYSWRETGMGSTSANADSLFQGHALKLEKARVFINVVDGTRGLTPQAIEIWRLMMEIPIAGVIPLENGNVYKNGHKSYTNRVLSIKTEKAPMSMFEYPQGYTLTRDSLYTIFFGRKAEDMAEIFWSK